MSVNLHTFCYYLYQYLDEIEANRTYYVHRAYDVHYLGFVEARPASLTALEDGGRGPGSPRIWVAGSREAQFWGPVFCAVGPGLGSLGLGPGGKGLFSLTGHAHASQGGPETAASIPTWKRVTEMAQR